MLEKFISLIFCSEIPHDELINVVYLFCLDLLLFSKKIGKIVVSRYKIADIKGPSINTRTSLLKSAEASSLFFFLCIYMGGICKLFKPKTRSFHLNLNSQRVFKNLQNFTSHDERFNFSTIFSDCQIEQVYVSFKRIKRSDIHLEVRSSQIRKSFEYFFCFHRTLGISPKDLEGFKADIAFIYTTLACSLTI